MLSPQILALMKADTERMMTQTCTIERETETRGEHGEPTRTWQIVAQNVKCRLITAKTASSNATAVVMDQEIMEDAYRLCVPVGTALAVEQRVTVAGAIYNVASIVDGRTNAVDVQAMVTRMRT